MTIGERVRALSGSRMSTTNEAFERNLRTAMLDVTRDQRHACVQALIDVYATARKGGVVTGDAAYQAVMNAPLGSIQPTPTAEGGG